jgi:hypothetical protein
MVVRPKAFKQLADGLLINGHAELPMDHNWFLPCRAGSALGFGARISAIPMSAR